MRMPKGYGSWLFAVFVAMVFFLPIYTANKGFVSGEEAGPLVGEILGAVAFRYIYIAAVIHVLAVALIVLLIKYGDRVGRFFSAFVAGDYILIAFIQSIAVVKDYGLSIILSNVMIFLFVGIVWAKEVYNPQSNFTFRRLPWWRYWVIPLALLAFWFPAGLQGEPDFNPIYLLTSDFGVAFCLTTPVVVAVLSLIYPRVNRKVLTATCYAGLLYGILNLAIGIFIPGAWWVSGVLHIPLFSISLYGLLLPKLVRSWSLRPIL